MHVHSEELGGGVAMSVELAAMHVGRSVASRAAQVWLEGRRRDQEQTLEMGELVRLRIPGLRSQRSVERQFEQIADAVAGRLEPLLTHEFHGLDDGDRQAVIDAVVNVFTHADLSDAAIVGADADAAELARRIRAQAPPVRGLGESASQFYEVLLAECCDCYVRLLRRLPVFNERAITELLSRVSNLGAEFSRVIERLPARSLYAPSGDDHDEEFRREYVSLISHDLDEVELFSILGGPTPRTMLSVAYISLRVSSAKDSSPSTNAANRRRTLLRAGAGSWDEQDEEPASVRVEAALGRTRRMLVLGEAGSGKTTLLSWLAVTAARRGFTGDLTDWNDLVPFLIKLRRYAGRDLPKLEAFLDGTAGPLTGHMPLAWVDRQFTSGRSLLMVDGVDELAASEREKVRDWLRLLLHAYPATHVVITSRPTAAHSDWLEAEQFTAVSLGRMTPADLRAFIRQWHQALHARGNELPLAPEDLPRYEHALVTGLQERPHLMGLAANPLLAAMLCALHLDRRRHLPRNRMELYQAALELLVQRRDAERGIPSAQTIRLSLTDKIAVLRDLAWRLSDNNLQELPEEKAVVYVSTKVTAMRHLNLDGAEVFEHLIGRSGVLRMPQVGRINFVHRTFQEYLAAAEAAAEDRIGNLIGRAHLDQWRETIIMAAGHGNRSQRIELITGILDRAASEKRHQRTLRLLAASCLETMESVPAPIAQRMDDCVDSLIPPRRSSEATSLALVGEPVLRRLPRTLEGLTDAAAEATIRAAALIGGSEATTLLSAYTADQRDKIREAIAFAWEYFDPAEYVRRVLARLSFDEIFLKLVHAGQWAELTSLTAARRLWFQYRLASGLEPFAAMPSLDWLWITRGIEGNDLTPLRRQSELRNLVLLYGTVLDDPSPISEMPELTNLQIEDWESIPRIADIPVPPKLESLGLGHIPIDTDLAPLEKFARLDRLLLQGDGQPRGLEVVGQMTSLKWLRLSGFDMQNSLVALAAGGPQLRNITMRNCSLPADLTVLTAMGKLRRLTLGNCTSPDGPVDLSRLARPENLSTLTIELWINQDVTGRDRLGPRIRVIKFAG